MAMKESIHIDPRGGTTIAVVGTRKPEITRIPAEVISGMTVVHEDEMAAIDMKTGRCRKQSNPSTNRICMATGASVSMTSR